MGYGGLPGHRAGVAAGLPPWAVSAVAAAVLLTLTALRSPQTLRRLRVPWAPLATLLWLQRCRAAGLRWRLGRLAVAGLLCSSLCVTAAVVALWATTP